MAPQQTEKQQKNKFKETLNLPKTNFPMKANLCQNEPRRLKEWQSIDLYKKILDKNKNAEPFILHDGPPYANGSIHLGHLLNKVLKDIVTRSQNIMGKKCEFVPGWDCHGLPIEHKVMLELLEKKPKKLHDADENTKHLIIRNECKKYAEKFIKLQSQQMEQLLTLGHYKTPYLTMDPDYESSVLDVFSKLVKENIVYRQLKPVHWSLENQTALAEAELEYKDKNDPSLYVNFEATNLEKINAIFHTSISHPIYFMIWTTTPWTLPANVAVAINKEYSYALVEHNKQFSIIAESLIKKIEETCSLTFKIHGKTSGESLLKQEYKHPFCNRISPILHASYVTLEDGTGLVHTAPGHGTDDYMTGIANNLPIYCPVNADGTYDNSVPEWLQGLHIWKANSVIIETLKTTNHLVHSYTFTHSYPHDWRSKTPVIFRSTEQWFINVDKPLKTQRISLRELALKNIDSSIHFIPEWGKNRLRGMLESRPDWCLSRQRSWGLPIPAFKTPSGDILLTEKSVSAVAKVIREEGSDAWFKSSPADLLKYYTMENDTEKPNAIEIEKLEKMYDIFDVWFESGSSWRAVLEERNIGFPADLYLEGSDQHRGWFHLSLLPSLGIHGQSPYKTVLTHGFIVDKEGKKMSKSIGNTLNVEDLLKNHGAEIARWWVSSLSFENDIKVDLTYFDKTGDSYRKVRNTIRFLLSNLYDYKKQEITPHILKEMTETVPPDSLEGFILEETSKLITTVSNAYKEFKFKQAQNAIFSFCNDTLSSLYCVAVKDRLYCDNSKSKRRLQSQKVLWVITEVLARILSPILPHTAEEMFQSLHSSQETSIHLQDWISFSYKASSEWPLLLEIKENVQKKLEEATKVGIENNLDAEVLLHITFPLPDSFKDNLADLFGVSRVTIISSELNRIEIKSLKNEPQCERSWKRDKSVKKRSDGSWLSDRDAKEVGVI
jgi:isoleucyl-tRNA synthetase